MATNRTMLTCESSQMYDEGQPLKFVIKESAYQEGNLIKERGQNSTAMPLQYEKELKFRKDCSDNPRFEGTCTTNEGKEHHGEAKMTKPSDF